MSPKRPFVPPYLQRSLAALIIFLMCISLARLLVTMHQQDERIAVLENTVAQLLADTTRLPIPQYAAPAYSSGRDGYGSRYPARSSRYPARSTDRYAGAATSAPASAPAASEASLAAGSTADSVIGRPVQPAADVSAPETKPRKFTSPHSFDLNTVDSLNLIRIPGIAARTASVILQQRVRYGGFYSPQQLRDFLTWDAALQYIDEWCTVWFTADVSRLRRIPVNTATIGELQRHPYINHEQAVQLTRYRTRHQRIATASELLQLDAFTSDQVNRLLPYLSFE